MKKIIITIIIWQGMLFGFAAMAEQIKISDTQYKETISTDTIVDIEQEKLAIVSEQATMDAQDIEAERIAVYYDGIHNAHVKTIKEHEKKIADGISIGLVSDDIENP